MFFTILFVVTSADFFACCEAIGVEQLLNHPTPIIPERDFQQRRSGNGDENQDVLDMIKQNNKKYDVRDLENVDEHNTARIIDNYIAIGDRLSHDLMENMKTELIETICQRIRSYHPESGQEYSLVDYACSFLSTNTHLDMFKATKLLVSLLNPDLRESQTSRNTNSNRTTKSRFARAADSESKEHQPTGVYPHIYPYNDEAGLHKLQKQEDPVYYIVHDQYHDTGYEEEPPGKYLQVYPGAYQPQYSYSKIPRSYWMFAIFKGLFTIWEILQTLAILYLLWKVAFLSFVPGREDTITNFLTQIWEDVTSITRLQFVQTSDSQNQRQDPVNTQKLSHSNITHNNVTESISNVVSSQIEQLSKTADEQNSNYSKRSRIKRSADQTFTDVPRSKETDESKNYGNNSSELPEFIETMRQEWREHMNVDCTSCENLRPFNRRLDVPWTNNRIISALVGLFSPSLPSPAQHHIQ